MNGRVSPEQCCRAIARCSLCSAWPFVCGANGSCKVASCSHALFSLSHCATNLFTLHIRSFAHPKPTCFLYLSPNLNKHDQFNITRGGWSHICGRLQSCWLCPIPLKSEQIFSNIGGNMLSGPVYIFIFMSTRAGKRLGLPNTPFASASQADCLQNSPRRLANWLQLIPTFRHSHSLTVSLWLSARLAQ